LFKKVLGKEHPDYATSLYHLANFNLKSGNIDDAAKYYSRFYECTADYILKNFALMTSNERTNFWNTRYEFLYRRSDFFSKDLPYIAYKINNADLNALAYNGQVFSKGLLLNAELELQKLIEHSNDTTFENRYYKIRQDRAKLDELYQLSPDERTIDTDSLLKVIDNEERLLVQSSKELGDYTKNLSIDWHNIQNNLKNNELAIEFANFKDTAARQEIYIALVLKKGMTSPELVKLFTLDDFYEIFDSEYYTTTKLYNLVWKPLEKYLSGVENVYFSPCGKFHTIGIEYLPDESGKIFAEKFNAYRLSSTRELALEHKPNPNKKAATYGGIKYDSDKGDGNVRGVATYLKGTKIESETVAKLLQSADFSVIALSDTLATEESFKNLSGSGLKILHIGTHGFYYAAENLENAGFSFFSDKQQSEEDKALSCSGLLFAGANFALDTENRSALPEGNDGILTAKEISRLDFKGLDLVVLSACQTGLGEVTGEGVFGLQRGFKKAGAQTIIMSLWEVDDYATRLLMTEFFKGLTAGKTKREAFLSALDFVKAKNSDPKYWAAFVMVDGE
jgi:CHAT domain-containing protein